MIKGLSKVLVAAFMGFAVGPSSMAQTNWTYVHVDPSDASFDVLSSADKRLFADTQLPLWAVMEPYVDDLTRSQSCYSLFNIGLGAEQTLKKSGDGIDEPSALITALEFASDWLSDYGFEGGASNRFIPLPGTVHNSAYRRYDGEWTSHKLVFCHTDEDSDEISSNLYDFALGAWDAPGYSGWTDSRYLKVDPSRWNEIEQDTFTHVFQAGLGLLRQYDYEKFGDGSEGRQPNDWAGAMGLLPAIAMLETENLMDLSRGAFTDPGQRYKYMPMQLDTPLVVYDSRAAETTSVDEAKFSAAAFWWTALTEFTGEANDQSLYLEALMSDRYDSDKYLDHVNNYLMHIDGETNGGLDFYLPQFVAVYANWPEVMFDGEVEEQLWLEESFDGCKTIEVDERSVYQSVTLELKDGASACIDVQISSALQAYSGIPHLRIDGEPDIIKETMLANSKSFAGDLCRNGDVKESKCLITPPQAKLANGSAARFHSGETLELTSGEVLSARYIVTRLPNISDPAAADYAEAKAVDFTFNLEVGSIDSPLPVSDNWSTNYAGKVGSAPIGPLGDSESANAEDAIFNRSTGTSRAVLGYAADGASSLLGLSNEVGDDLIFIPDDRDILKTRQTGTFDASASMTYADDEVYTRQDPDLPSKLNITEHSEFALRFAGTANVCFIRRSDEQARQKELVREGIRIGLMDSLEARERAHRELEARMNLQDPCAAAFRRGPIKVRASVPFPVTWTREGTLETWITDGYLKLRDLRASRIREQLFGGNNIKNGAPGGSTTPTQPGEGDETSSSQSGGIGGLCTAPIFSNDQGCDCSCEAKACLQSRSANGLASASEKGCRLFCGSGWATCES